MHILAREKIREVERKGTRFLCTSRKKMALTAGGIRDEREIRLEVEG